MNQKDVIEVYEEILSNQRKVFQHGTWSPTNGGYDSFRRVFRYLVLEKLNYNREQLLQELDKHFIKKWKLNGALHILFDDIVFKTIQFAFPEWNIRPWEMKITPNNFWTEEENIIEAFRWLGSVKTTCKTKDEFLTHFSCTTMHNFGFRKITQFQFCHYSNLAFPNWELTEEDYKRSMYRRVAIG